MKKIERLKLHNLSKTEMEKNQMKMIVGGYDCYCYCHCSSCNCPCSGSVSDPGWPDNSNAYSVTETGVGGVTNGNSGSGVKSGGAFN